MWEIIQYLTEITMNNQENQNELLQVQKEIAELPAGYISRKNIKGKTRYYLQWTEDGKKKSKYVDDALVDDLRAKIPRLFRTESLKKFSALRGSTNIYVTAAR